MSDNYPPGVVLEEIPCPLDGSTEFDVVVYGGDLIYHIPGVFRVVRCKTCGLMRTTPRPTLETIGTYYPDNYLPYETSRITHSKATALSTRGIKSWIKRFVNYNLDPLPAAPAGRMLEIGCASGQYMYEMKQKGWDVEGIEPSASASAAARELGFPVHTGALETAPERNSTYDLIVGWMVLEHLHDPVGALKRLQSWAKPGSWAVFSIPNAASLEFKIFGKAWYGLHLPMHTFHYTPNTVAGVLEQGGWRLERVYHQRVLTNFFMSLGFWLKCRGWDNKLANSLTNFNQLPWRVHQLLYPLAWFLSLFGQTGRMTVWAKRIDD